MYTCICDVRVYTRRRVCLLRKTPSSLLGHLLSSSDDRTLCTPSFNVYFLYVFRVPVFTQTHTHTRAREGQQIKLSLPVLSSTGNCICVYPPTVRAVRMFHTRAMRIQLRRDDFVSSMKICFRDCPAMQSRHGVYSIPNVEYIVIVSRETHNNVEKYGGWLFLNAV